PPRRSAPRLPAVRRGPSRDRLGRGVVGVDIVASMDRDSSAPDAPPAALPLRAAGVILAAGAGSRFGGDKLVASLQGRPILHHVLDAAVRAGLDPIVVVEPPSGALRDLDLTPARRVINPRPEEGLSSSVRLALRE